MPFRHAILIRAFFEIADTDADMENFQIADTDADTDIEIFQIADMDADTDVEIFQTADRDANTDIEFFQTTDADTDMIFSKNRGHGHDADKPRTCVSTDLLSSETS